MWAREHISNGEIDQIIDPRLRQEISPDSLKAFLRVAERCLRDESKKRPAVANVVLKLEFALKQQESAESLVPIEISTADVFPSTDRTQQENAISFLPNEIANVADGLLQQEDAKSPVPNDRTDVADVMEESFLPNEIISVANPMPSSDRTILSMSRRQLTIPSSDVQNVTSPVKEQISSKMFSAGKKTMHKLSRLLP